MFADEPRRFVRAKYVWWNFDTRPRTARMAQARMIYGGYLKSNGVK